MNASDDNLNNHNRSHEIGNAIGEGVGGLSGIAAGAAIGSAGGPVGTIIGGIAGAIGGWWAGRGISEAAGRLTGDDDSFYRSHYDSSDNRLADRSYDDVSPAYHLGHLAAHNPDYNGKSFDNVENDLRRGWDSAAARAHGEWDQVRGYARDAYTRSSGTLRSSEQHTSPEADAAAENANNRIDNAAGTQSF